MSDIAIKPDDALFRDLQVEGAEIAAQWTESCAQESDRALASAEREVKAITAVIASVAEELVRGRSVATDSTYATRTVSDNLALIDQFLTRLSPNLAVQNRLRTQYKRAVRRLHRIRAENRRWHEIYVPEALARLADVKERAAHSS